MQVIDILESTGEATAGQLATLMGLTTGTFTAILNRLEKAGLVRRERDPNDGRRVIVRLVTGSEVSRRSILFLLSLGKRGRKWRRNTTMSKRDFYWSFFNAATRSPRKKLHGCKRRRWAMRGSSLLRWSIWKAPGLSYIPR